MMRSSLCYAAATLASVGSLVSLVCLAHEGHEPLPSKGAVVNAQRGTIALATEAVRMLDVRTAEVKEHEHVDHGFAFVTVESPWNQVAFSSSRLPGRITTIHVRSGDTVHAGQVLAELESRELELLHLDYANALNELAAAENVLALLTTSSRGGAVPELRMIEAENSVRQARNRLWVLQSKVSILGLPWKELNADEFALSTRSSAGTLQILAPIGGTVLQQDAVIGQFVEPNTHLFQIVDNSTLWARLSVLEKDIGSLHIGRNVTLTLNAIPENTFETHIEKISYGIDPITQQIAAWCLLTNDDPRWEIRPGMNGQARFDRSELHRKLSVPRSAVWSDGLAHYVFVETAATKQGAEYERRWIWINDSSVAQNRLGKEQDPSIEYIELQAGGLFSSDRLVVQGSHELASMLSRQSLKFEPKMAASLGIRFEAVLEQSVDQILTLDATVDLLPMHRTRIASQLPGTLKRILVDRSQSVRAGDILAEVSSLEVVDLQLNLLRSQLDWELQNDAYQRLSTAGPTISPRILLDLKTGLVKAQALTESLERQLKWIGFDESMVREVSMRRALYDSFPVRAATDGVVVDFLGTLGTAIPANQDLFEIHELDKALVRAFVPAKNSTRIRLDQSVRVRLSAYPNEVLDGRVARISPIVDKVSGVQSLWIELKTPNKMELRDRMLGRASVIIGTTSPMLAAPRSAVIHEGTRSYVFVQEPDGRLERRRVDLADGDDRFLILRSGIQSGESIAVTQVPELQTAYASIR